MVDPSVLKGLVLTQIRQRIELATAVHGWEQRQNIDAHIERIEVHLDKVVIEFADPAQAPITVSAAIIRRGKETRLAISHDDGAPVQRDPALIKLIVNADIARKALAEAGERSIAEVAEALGYTRDYYGVLLRISSLAPDIVAAICNGRQPVQLNRQRLARMSDLPIDWQAQRKVLGFV